MVGAAIAAHPDVDMISFTGSTAVGAQITRLAADRIARVALELGGKSANVILDDADLAKAVKVGVANAFLNSGQTCTAWTRMLVHRSRYDEALEIAGAVARFAMGDPLTRDPAGPSSARSSGNPCGGTSNVRINDGARVIAGGLRAGGPATPATSSPGRCWPTWSRAARRRAGGDLRARPGR